MVVGPTSIANGRYGEFEGLASDRVVLGHYRAHGDWSPALLDLVCERLRPRTVVDVGANIGLFSIPVAQRCDARCLCFEPEPGNHHLLRANVARHGLDGRIETFPLAAYSEARTLPMVLSPDNAGDHHVVRAAPGAAEADEAPGAPAAEVHGERLDVALAGRTLAGPVVLKLDTQGCELRALLGATALLPQVDHCILEYWPAGLRRVGDRAARLREQLMACFPRAALLTETGPETEPVPTADLMARLAFLGDDDPGFLDLWLTR